MTTVDVPPDAALLPVCRRMPLSGCGLPAAALHDAATAAFVRAHGISVTVRDAADVALVRAGGIRAGQILLRCGGQSEMIRCAAASGVSRFVVSTERHVSVVADCSPAVKNLYLDTAGPAVFGDRCLRVVGIHCELGDSMDASAWRAAVDQMLARTAALRRCGLSPDRISLAGGSAQRWFGTVGCHVDEMAAAVDDALADGCPKWRLPRPTVLLTPQTG